MCIDYRGLNAITVKNREPLPRIDDLLDRAQGCRYFSKIDLKFGYHQIAIRPEDQPKTAFQTRYGLYEFVVMPFGLCNAPGTFQHAMNQIFHDYLDKFVIVYLNDILIFRRTVEEHVAHLDKVLSLLRQHKFNINGEKCEFGRTRILYLGHEISAEGLKPNDAKVASSRDWLRPQYVTEMRSFLGMTGYYRNFVKNYSIVAAPLTDLTRLDTPWEWTDRPGESLSMDFMDTLVTSKSGMRHIFVIVDRFSKYARLVAMSETTKTEYVIRLFKENWVRDFGLPKSIEGDKDVLFTSPDGPSYVVHIPRHLRTHPIFYASKLAPFKETDQFPSRRSMLPPTMDGEVDIDDIVDHKEMPVPRPTGRGRPPKPKLQYRVRFRYHTDPKEDRWFTQEELMQTAPQVVVHYEKLLQKGKRQID
ncbi:hypothetical protein CBR_g32508 [Chara braunii]|uniref:Reverse transcriptase domain-containing protein n=1 Tax=Chara braunii TaxID=69332 RepID=A0A388LGS9_CHABU|nr:hypothetical protein CBR_g32508 [Chara braunii]|eukprot:GBG81519.1 hypothetical protein CBR_g32508 [Chara braunii]